MDSTVAGRTFSASRLDRRTLIPIILGILTVVGIISLVYQVNRAAQYRVDASEVWSAHQVKTIKAAIEEDPNLKEQYAEELDVLGRDAQALRDKTAIARNAVAISAYSALILLLGAATSVLALVVNSAYTRHAAIAMGIVGVGLGIRAMF